MSFALWLLLLDALLVAAAFAYIWLALVPAWLGRAAQDTDNDGNFAVTTTGGSPAIETLRQRRQPAHRRHAAVFFSARTAR